MKEFSGFRPTAGKWMDRLAATSLEVSKRGIALALVGLMIPMGIAQVAFAQEALPPPPDQQGPPPDQGPPPPDEDAAPPQNWNALSPDQLNQLVAPIALYPDSLVAQVLGASTYPTQIVEADRFVQSQAGAPPEQIAQMVNGQNWDPSVKALVAFPSVLANMDKNLEWTTNLGNAYYNQPQDVMNAVQGMRQQAYAAGHLQSTPQLDVQYSPGDIVIAPANPAVVYVPYYDPWVMYGFHPYYAWYAPPPPVGWRVGFGFGFGVGVAVGVWGGYGWGWGHWGFAWGAHPYVAFNHVSYVSRSVTVVNHGYYGRFDRAPGARSYNVQAAHAAYAHGYAAGARNGYNRGENNGYNRGVNNSNRPAPGNFSRPNTPGNNNYNRPNTPGNNNYNRPQGNNNYNRPNAPANNNNRPTPNSNLARPPQNNGSYNRPSTPGNYNRPSTPTKNSRPAPQSRPAPHTESRPSGGGEHPHGGGGEKGGGDKGGHPHGR
ncbi:MAG TPA: DUF3300 domain-containing protein [Acidobacteriaceae bacterium]|jgi:hypothetical protein|nr:DUF3300 domain-containing protein [Acidobacteriaceae bacterium]